MSRKLPLSLDETKTDVLSRPGERVLSALYDFRGEFRWFLGSECSLLCVTSEVNFDGWKIDGCQMQFDLDSGSCSEAVSLAGKCASSSRSVGPRATATVRECHPVSLQVM